jgi:hypothetical protein
VVGIVLPICFIIPFVLHTQRAAEKLTGSRQFSFLTGWQLTNNVLYMYEHLKVDSNDLPVGEPRIMNRFALAFTHESDSIKDFYYDYEHHPNSFLVYGGPLHEFFSRHRAQPKDSTQDAGFYQLCVDWGRTSALLEPFGKSVILHHPIGYVCHFIIPNARNYFLPPLSDLQAFHMGSHEFLPYEKRWFNYSSNAPSCFSVDAQRYLMFYRLLFLILNVLFVAESLIVIFKRKSLSIPGQEYKLYLLIVSYTGLNFLFSISVSVNILRYQYIRQISRVERHTKGCRNAAFNKPINLIHVLRYNHHPLLQRSASPSPSRI